MKRERRLETVWFLWNKVEGAQPLSSSLSVGAQVDGRLN
jgi:hypothetical protein